MVQNRHRLRHIETVRERILISDGLGDVDGERLLVFSEQLDRLNQVDGQYRHLELLRRCTRTAEEVSGLDAARTDREATNRILNRVNETNENPGSKPGRSSPTVNV